MFHLVALFDVAPPIVTDDPAVTSAADIADPAGGIFIMIMLAVAVAAAAAAVVLIVRAAAKKKKQDKALGSEKT